MFLMLYIEIMLIFFEAGLLSIYPPPLLLFLNVQLLRRGKPVLQYLRVIGGQGIYLIIATKIARCCQPRLATTSLFV
jgi:hypothetical protein